MGMRGTMITFKSIPTKFTQFMKNIKIGAVHMLAQIVGTKYSFQNLQSKKSDFSFLSHFFFSFLFSTKFCENFWNKTIQIIAPKLRINPISYHKLNGLKIRIAINAYIIDLRIEISLPRNRATKVKLHITAALKTLASLPHIIA
jgi:hypothetical protein